MILRLSVLFLAVCLFSCSTVPLSFSQKGKRGGTVVIWAHADLQPRNDKEKTSYETAVNDVAANIGSVDAAIVAGDIIQSGGFGHEEEDLAWFESVRSKANIDYWYEIAGNHDARASDIFLKHVQKPLHYAVRMGNLLMIFLSDENGETSGSEISDRAFLWWKDLVEKNQNNIIMTVTHTNLDNAGFRFAILPYRNIGGSKRFEEVLEKQRVDIWLSGHTHMPSKLNMNEILPGRYGNKTLFLNVASIRKDFFFSEIESRFLIFEKGSGTMTVKTRYHNKQTFADIREFSVDFPVPFEWDGKKPVFTEFK